MEEIELETIEKDDEMLPIQLPVNFIEVGHVDNDDVKVYIKQSVYKELEEYAKSDVQNELGTILLGKYCSSMGTLQVMISDFIYAKYTDASASTLTFTHETWEYVHKVHEKKYPEEKIVGWQHTHPSYGIFLSNYDMFIQENFFNLDFQIAYVIDPIQTIRGFFQWKNGKVERLNGFYIYDEIGEEINIDDGEKIEDASEQKYNRKIKVLVGLLSALVVILFFSTSWLYGKYKVQIKGLEVLKEEIVSQTEVINEKEEQIRGFENCEVKDAGEEQKDSEKSSDNIHISLMKYTVEKGDSLYRICEKNHINYEKNYKFILSYNGINNPDYIQVGQKLYIPVE